MSPRPPAFSHFFPLVFILLRQNLPHPSFPFFRSDLISWTPKARGCVAFFHPHNSLLRSYFRFCGRLTDLVVEEVTGGTQLTSPLIFALSVLSISSSPYTLHLVLFFITMCNSPSLCDLSFSLSPLTPFVSAVFQTTIS